MLHKLPRDRAAGTSQLTYDHIRYAATRDQGVFDMLRDTLNFMLNNPEKVDAQAFTAQAYFLPKKDGKVRPIVLQECLTKILHKCINRRILCMIATAMPRNQYCINNSNGACAAALQIQEQLKAGKDKFFGAVDFSNAFNTLRRAAIIKNLEELGVGRSYIRYIATYLNRFSIEFQGRIIRNGRGVPQGCPLSMTLFSIGTSHVLRRLGELGVGAAAYADDLVISAETEEQLHQALEEVTRMGLEMGLELNRAKAQLFTVAPEDTEGFRSLHTTVWEYLGIPISLNKGLLRGPLPTSSTAWRRTQGKRGPPRSWSRGTS